MSSTEIAEAVARAEARTNTEPYETAIADAVADLMILAHERGVSTAEVVVSGVAHYLATYIEHMAPEEASEFVSDALFPWTGEREFAEYLAERGIAMAGHSFPAPEWGI